MPARLIANDLGVLIGHWSDPVAATGCTVVLCPRGAVGGIAIRGGAPCSRETEILAPMRGVAPRLVHGAVLAGGSVFGLAATDGVVRWLSERGIGLQTGHACIPIVPALGLYDLGIGDPERRPDAAAGCAACAAAGASAAEGRVGAGTGATVGKMGQNRSMKGGLGSASITLPDGLVVAALVAVNAVGDVIDPATGNVVAGVRTDDGKGLADARTLLRSGALLRRAQPRSGENTTIGVVATNAKLTKVQAQKVAQMAHDGFARAIYPVHTQVDGDTVFALATGTDKAPPNMLLIGSLAADVTAEAIVRAARAATGLPNLPAARDRAR